MQRTSVACLVLLALGVLVVSLTTEAQPPTTVHRIGWLSGWSPSPDPNGEVFRQHLRELGYVEGHNLVLELRYAEGKAERLPALATELVHLPVDVIVAEGAAAIRAAQQATRTIPIVMAATTDPVAQGFVASLAHPGGEYHRLELPERGTPGQAAGAPQGDATPEHAHRRLRGCLKSSGCREPTSHQTRHREINHRLTALRQPFIVFAQAA